MAKTIDLGTVHLGGSDAGVSGGGQGLPGKSAYQEWLDAGNVGSVSDFLASLKGAQGPKGNDGSDGTAGPPGEKGADGSPGKSAYQVWRDLGNQGSEQDFINHLKAKQVEVVNNLESDDENKALSAKQGKRIKQLIDDLPSGEPMAADEEDLTVSEGKMSFKDKEYSVSDFSGLGRVYLKKNLQSGKNILFQTAINKTNTRFIIRNDFDLNGKTITFANGSVLCFEGGTFKNGAIKGTDIIIESSYPCFDKTLVVLPNSLKGNVLNLEWFKMERWTVAQYTANHRNNTNPAVSDTNRIIVNKHLRYRLIVPSGIFPFDNRIELVKSFSEYGSSYDSGCSLNIQGYRLAEYSDKTVRSAFVFPKSGGFYWSTGVGNAINSVRDMYFEAHGNIFHLWGNFNVSNMDIRTPNAWTNNDFHNIEMVSWMGSGFYSPANYKDYVYYNKYEYIKGWFPNTGKGFWEGMCNMQNTYNNVTLQYMGLDGKSFEGSNFSVFVNQSAYIDQGNFDKSRYILHYSGNSVDFQKRYESQNAYFYATRCQFEALSEGVVYTGGQYVSVCVSFNGCSLIWYPSPVSKPVVNVSRLKRFDLNSFYTVGVPKDKMLSVSTNIGGDNVINSDVDLIVHFEGIADMFIPARSSSFGSEDLRFLYSFGRTNPQKIKAVSVDTLGVGLIIGSQQIVGDDVDLINTSHTLKSNNLLFRKSSQYILPYIADAVGVHIAKHIEGRLLV